ncbi:MAG: hypothetical protein V4631_04650 [Pseudomonadota bacterium]
MGSFPEYPYQFFFDESAGDTPPGPVAPPVPALPRPQEASAQFSPAYLSPAAWTSYHDRFSADIGGGVYPRVLGRDTGARMYRVRKLGADGEFATITQALAQWNADKQGSAAPRTAVIEVADSATYHEAPQFRLAPGEHLQLRAASMVRPVLRMFDYGSGVPEQIRICGAPGSRLTLDGLLVAGGGIAIDDGDDADGSSLAGFHVTFRHCTLVPDWEPESIGQSPWRGKPSVMLRAAGVALRVDHSIVGPIRVASGARTTLHVGDSIIDAGHAAGLAISDARYGAAHAIASFVRATVIGLAQVQELVLAENSLFLGPLLAARRHLGSVRFCYLEQGSRTPRREYCQPDLALENRGVELLRPRFLSLRYGTPGYCQLAHDCALEISCGGDDDAAMGAFHDQLQPSAAAHGAGCQIA